LPPTLLCFVLLSFSFLHDIEYIHVFIVPQATLWRYILVKRRWSCPRPGVSCQKRRWPCTAERGADPPSHRVSLGLMTVSERPPAKYLVGPLVVRFLAHFLMLGPQTVSRGVEPASLVDICKNIFYISSPAFSCRLIFLSTSLYHSTGVYC
jgi:hypothetical protein